MSEDVGYFKNQILQSRMELKNLRHQLSALKHEHSKQLKLIKSTLNSLRCSACANTATTLINIPNGDGSSTEHITYKPIGVIESSFQNKRAVPRQPTVLNKIKGTVVIDPSVFNNPEHAFSGLEEFSHIWIIFHFHATESTSVPAKVAPPRLGGERRGVFSTRSPHRPCSIGLSLVKIDYIEGNKIHFLGVDMVNGTPVLDVKPYIPQYDYPSPTAPFAESRAAVPVRPPTEGNSDGIENLAGLTINDDGGQAQSLSPRVTNPIGIDTASAVSRPFEDEVPSPGNEHSTLLTPVSPSPDSPSSGGLIDGTSFTARSPVSRPDSERGAPDGQERFTPPQSAHLMNVAHDGIRVAPWIANPPSQTYEVRFTDDALQRLVEQIGSRAPAFKSNIETLLTEDPRSHYVRNRYPDHEYNCVLEELSISCIFDADSATCTIVAIRSAEDLQN